MNMLELSPGGDYVRQNLAGLDFAGCNFSRSDFTEADLSASNLTGANFTNALLVKADLSAANLEAADLSGADLSNAKLVGANLSGANLLRAKLSAADLRGAVIRNVKVGYVTRLNRLPKLLQRLTKTAKSVSDFLREIGDDIRRPGDSGMAIVAVACVLPEFNIGLFYADDLAAVCAEVERTLSESYTATEISRLVGVSRQRIYSLARLQQWKTIVYPFSRTKLYLFSELPPRWRRRLKDKDADALGLSQLN